MLAVIAGIVFLTGCDAAGSNSDGDVVGGVDLDVLFAPARSAEINAAASVWSQRNPAAAGVSLVLEGEVSHPFAPGWTSDLRVFAHEVDGYTHYGAVVAPSSDPDEVRPVLLYLHGGDAGVDISDVALAMAVTPEMRDEYVVVVPSFRSEPLAVGDDILLSEGPPSPWDRDVDDTIALLNVALENTPAADPERVVVVGFSRGATVGLIAAARDERIDGVVNFFGPMDFLGAFAREVTRDMLRDDLPALPGIRTINETLLEPLQDGETTIEQVRLDLIRRSPVYFVDRLPPVQIHHGLNDPIVPPAEAEALADAFNASGRTNYEAYYYPGGGHDPLTLDGALDRLKTFLLQWTNPPA